eukprot:COSAG01_NODE_6167_length_3814_cov_24.241992_2_plen_559_part_00
MVMVTRAFFAFLAVPPAMGHSAAPAPAFAGVADPAARTALEKMQRGLQGLANTVSSQAQELEAQRAHSAALEARLGEAEATLSRFVVHEGEGDGDRRPSAKATSATSDVREGDTFRRAQEVPPDNTTVVHIHRVSVVLPDPPGTGMSPNYNGGRHRRTQKGVCGQISMRAAAIQAECCDEPSEDCGGGVPHTCNTDCADIFLPFWEDCGAQLGSKPQYLSVVTMCLRQAADSGSATPHITGSGGLAHQFNLVCASSATDGCVPACTASVRGDLLLMNLNGEDSKYSCELHHGLHSWVGAATDGGYLGRDARTFVSAVVSAAAGYYALLLAESARISADVTVRLGQDVRVSGSSGGGSSTTAAWPASTPPLWGDGAFLVERGRLQLAHLVLRGALSVRGGSALLDGAMLSGGAVTVTVRERGCLVLASIQLSVATWDRVQVADAGSELRLLNVAVSGSSLATSEAVLSGNITVAPQPRGRWQLAPPDFWPLGAFSVISGPCTTRQNGRCVGRPHGYQPGEQCAIQVSRGGTLGPCPVFQVRTISGADACVRRRYSLTHS